MSIDVFSIHCDALDGARLAGFKGTEALSRPFEFDLFFTIPVGTDVKGAIGARATLTADRDDGRGPMSWHGILAGLRLVHETAERALYRASLVPALWLLQQHVRSFVFTKKKVDTFAAETLKDGGLQEGDFQFHTDAGAYPMEEFVCQYRESHLDFLHRWFEREGLYYYFEHPEGAGATEKLVIVDDKAHHHALLGDGHVRYFPTASHDGSAGESFRELHADFRLLPASVHISDYNYANPAAPLAGEKAVSGGSGQGKIREYGYRVFSDGEAKRLAQIKAQSIACRELVLTATGTYLGLRAGYTFQVEDGPSDLPSEYLALEVRHAGAVSGAAPMVLRYTGLDPKETYRAEVVAIPANVQFRAPQTTPWPRIYGFENGTVDGPGESQYAQIDDQGRYLVRFKFDVSDLPDGSTSTYLRMMQPHGGATEGWHFPLRKGTEVMVSFQGGDPDRPVIAGVVPNAVQPSNVTARNHTQNVLRTGGDNYLIMDDLEGTEYIDMGTPVARTRQTMGKYEVVKIRVPSGKQHGDSPMTEIVCTYRMTTDENATFHAGKNWYQSVGACYFLDVAGDATIHYGGTEVFQVDKLSTQYLNGGLKQIITQDGEQQVFSNWKQHVAARNHGHFGQWDVTVDTTWKVLVGGAATITAAGNVEIASTAGIVAISAPSTIDLRAPKVQMHTGFYKGVGSSYLELYESRTTVGAHKSDYSAIYTCGYGVKMETTGYSAGLYNVKGDTASVKADTFGSALRHLGADVLTAALGTASFGLNAVTAGLHSLK